MYVEQTTGITLFIPQLFLLSILPSVQGALLSPGIFQSDTNHPNNLRTLWHDSVRYVYETTATRFRDKKVYDSMSDSSTL